MLLHTIMDPVTVWNRDNEQAEEVPKEIVYKGVRLEITRSDQDSYVVNRIISTDLKDYLNAEIQPGSRIELIPRTQDMR